ncbi:MAG: peptidoglycan-binding protein [Bauldia sp.]|nr:peptidoglycan-binding protein [Bauldia sp.]
MKFAHFGAAAVLLALATAGGPALAQVSPAVPPAPGPPAAELSGVTDLTVAEVVELQTLLGRLGFDPRGIDGIVGAATRAAITEAQQALGLPVDGRPSLALLERLRQDPAANPAPSALPPAA